ncbi:MAG TPA: 2-dehydropantoate 2-reductase [Candidatus Didemnitutus sp.]|nr:2-dehydropantoate 2-reductase [Candidatus Didemnitutus sp.]
MPTIAIVGPGAIGSVMAVWLGQTGRHEVTLCARRTVSELLVETPQGPLRLRPTVITDPAAAKPVDWILVTTKANDTAGAAAWLPPLAANGAPVAILQNGVEHVERFSPFMHPDRIVPVMVDCPAERSTPSRTRQRGPAKLVVPDTTRGREFVSLFAGTAVDATTTTDFRSAIWRKLCINVAGVISALLEKPSGIMRDPQIGEVSLQLVRECIAVGRAEGAVLDDSLAQTVLAAYRDAPPDSVNSLQADRTAGRPMEIDARNGVILRLGRKHGIATPANQMAVALLEAMVRRPEAAR